MPSFPLLTACHSWRLCICVLCIFLGIQNVPVLAADDLFKGEFIPELLVLPGAKPLPKLTAGTLAIVPDGETVRYSINDRRCEFYQLRSESYDAILQNRKGADATSPSETEYPKWIVQIDHRLPISTTVRALRELRAAGVKSVWIESKNQEKQTAEDGRTGVHWDLDWSGDSFSLLEITSSGSLRLNDEPLDQGDITETLELTRQLPGLRATKDIGSVLIRWAEEAHSGRLLQVVAIARLCGLNVTSESDAAPPPSLRDWRPPKDKIQESRTLDWLARAQNVNGSWGKEHQGGLTGVGVLCFLSHGEVSDGSQWGGNVFMAIRWLISRGEQSRGWLCQADSNSAAGSVEHGIATWALCEYYTMTLDDRVLPVLKAAVTHVVAGQGDRGGWAQGYDRKKPEQLKITSWQLLALRSAKLTELKLPDVDSALEKAWPFLKMLRGDEGGFGNEGRSSLHETTSMGVFSAFLVGKERNELREQIDWISEHTERTHPRNYSANDFDLTAAFFSTFAALEAGGATWALWARPCWSELAALQHVDGSWPTTGNRAPELFSNSEHEAAIWRTARCFLISTCFFRYLPILLSDPSR